MSSSLPLPPSPTLVCCPASHPPTHTLSLRPCMLPSCGLAGCLSSPSSRFTLVATVSGHVSDTNAWLQGKEVLRRHPSACLPIHTCLTQGVLDCWCGTCRLTANSTYTCPPFACSCLSHCRHHPEGKSGKMHRARATQPLAERRFSQAALLGMRRVRNLAAQADPLLLLPCVFSGTPHPLLRLLSPSTTSLASLSCRDPSCLTRFPTKPMPGFLPALVRPPCWLPGPREPAWQCTVVFPSRAGTACCSSFLQTLHCCHTHVQYIPCLPPHTPLSTGPAPAHSVCDCSCRRLPHCRAGGRALDQAPGGEGHGGA